MPDLDYGYVITIAKNATSIPEHTPTNQWQRKPSSSTWSNISGATGITYTVVEADRGCDIRLQQDLGGALTFSNSLTVTSAVACPSPTAVPKLEPSQTVTNGQTLLVKTPLLVPGLDPDDITATVFRAHNRNTNALTIVGMFDGRVDSFEITDDFARDFRSIQCQQEHSISNTCHPSGDSTFTTVVYVPSKSFGSAALTGPASGEVGTAFNFELNYDGNVEIYDASVTFPYALATFTNERKTKGKYSFTLTYNSPSDSRVSVDLTSREANTVGENPLQRAKQVKALAPQITLGTVTVDGVSETDVGQATPYEVQWNGTATESDVTIQWATDASSVDPGYNVSPSDFTWSTEKPDAFVMAQVSCPKCSDKTFDLVEQPVKVNGPQEGTNDLGSFGTSGNKWWGATIGQDGMIYAAPSHQTKILKIDPTTDTVSLVGNSFSSTSFKFSGMCRHEGSNDIYLISATSPYHYKFNSQTGAISSIPGAVSSASGTKFMGGNPTKSNKIVGTAAGSTAGNQHAIIDTSTGGWSTSTQPSGVSAGYSGAVYGNNSANSLALVPHGAAQAALFDVSKSSARRLTTIGSASGGVSGSKWAGGAMAPNGIIYCAPHSAKTILAIDAKAGTLKEISSSVFSTGTSKWWGAVLAHNGKIYFIPARYGYILEFDPTTETCKKWGDDLGSTSNNKYRGGVLAPNGKIYCIPSYSASVLAIDLGLGPVNGKTWTVSGLPNDTLDPLSPLFNNC